MKHGLGSALKEVPSFVWACITFLLVSIIAAFVVLAITGSSSDDLRSFLNTILNIAGVLLGSGGLAFGASAAVNSKRASEQTNGNLKPVVKAAAKEAIQEVLKDGDPDVEGK